MNKKILSCALVAAMLASSVGAMGVSAATTKDADAFGGTNYPRYYAYDFTAEPDTMGTSFDINTNVNEDTVVFVDDVADVDTYENGVIYMFDFVADNDTSGTTLDDVDDAQGNATELKKMLNGYLKDSETEVSDTITVNADTSDYSAASSTRKTVIKEFLDVVESAEDLEGDKSFYDKTEWDSFAIDDLIDAIQGVTVTSTPTSQMAYLVSEYNRLVGTISPVSSWQDKYEELLEEVDELNEEDYSTVNWRKVQNKIDLADAYAADEDYENAYKTLKEVYNVQTETPDYADLKDALYGLFTEKGEAELEAAIAQVQGADTPANYNVAKIDAYKGTHESNTDNDKYTYFKEDFDDEDLWNEFAGKGSNSEGTNYVAGAYREAVKVYALCTKSATRKYVAQSTVDTALNNLNDALLALDPNYSMSNWVTVRLEDALAKADAVIEDDYRTTASAWKKFVEAKEQVEKDLASDLVKDDKAMDDAKALEDAIDGLSAAKKSVPTETKTALKDAIAEAKTLLKDQTGKTATQIRNLEDAYEAAGKITSANLISEYETAIADLNTAMTAYKQAQGWYKDANGTWYYGKEDTVAKGWLNVNGVWYLLDDTTGAMKTGWQQVNGTWYYMDASGAMKTGWLNLNGTYYYLESWGGMATGWKNVNGSWYYLQGSGAMVANGWYWINGKCYYFYNWGGMAANTTIDGYTVDASGAWVK